MFALNAKEYKCCVCVFYRSMDPLERKSSMSDKPKMIIGVPVLPIPGNSRLSVSGSEDILQEGPTEASHVTGTQGQVPQWKLRHVDFIPQQIKSKKDEEFETFP